MAPLVWLVTGTTSGIGLSLVKAISARGDIVIASGRSATTRLSHLATATVHPLDLDVTGSRADIDAAIAKAIEICGRVDVLINNAGISKPAPLEEVSLDTVREVFDVNLLGALQVTQAILPHMRQRKTGRIGFIGAGFGWATLPFLGVYAMSKAALTIFVEALQKEVGPFGVDAVIFEPGGVETGMGDRLEKQKQEAAAKAKANPNGGADVPMLAGGPQLDCYKERFGKTFGQFASELMKDMPSDPDKLSEAVVDVLRSEGKAKGRDWPVRVILGADCLAIVRQKCREQLQLCDEWEDVSNSVARDQWSGKPAPFILKGCSILTGKKNGGG